MAAMSHDTRRESCGEIKWPCKTWLPLKSILLRHTRQSASKSQYEARNVSWRICLCSSTPASNITPNKAWRHIDARFYFKAGFVSLIKVTRTSKGIWLVCGQYRFSFLQPLKTSAGLSFKSVWEVLHGSFLPFCRTVAALGRVTVTHSKNKKYCWPNYNTCPL